MNASTDAGSSPLTRGKRSEGEGGEEHQGLIPAHAGKTKGEGKAPGPTTAHPRSRGENGQAGGKVTERRGSSPLTRGKRTGLAAAGWAVGLIPAHAGKTFLLR